MSEENKIIVLRFYQEVMNQGKVELLDEIMAADFRDHGETLFGSPQGREVLKAGILGARSLLSDLTVQIHDILGDGELVGVRGIMRCTQQGPFLGVDPSGNELSWTGLAIFRVVDGRLTERWFNSDSLSIVQQLGIVPPLGG